MKILKTALMEAVMKKLALVLALLVFTGIALNVFAADVDSEKALKYYNSGKYEQAIKLYQDYISKTPDPAAYYRIGYALYKLGRFAEANEYFKQAYLLNPTFTPEVDGDYARYQARTDKARGKEPEKEIRTIIPEPADSTVETVQQPAPSAVQSQVQQPQPLPTPAPAPGTGITQVPQPLPLPETKKAPLPPMMMPSQGMPGGIEGIISGVIAGFAMIFLIAGLVFYLFFCFCLFKIAKKLDVPSPWTAWIPLVQTWTWVACAGKPWWWILLLLVPVVNFFLSIYLWMCISENLGKNKWTGLLFLLPIINFVYVAWLAFSRSEKAGGSSEEVLET